MHSCADMWTLTGLVVFFVCFHSGGVGLPCGSLAGRLTSPWEVSFLWSVSRVVAEPRKGKAHFSHSVNTLKCYVCGATNNNDQCNQNSQDCNPPLDTCMSTVDTLNGVKAIVKQCASRATCAGAEASASVDNAGNGNKVSCCRSRLCNYNAAVNIRLTTWLLVLPFCLLAVTLTHTA